MASYNEHLDQARRNLTFLLSANERISDSWDWQVTTCFYVAVHLVNAHIAVKANQHYRSHEQVKEALNPYNQLSLTKLDENTYIAFDKLQNLSRRSRYLCNDNVTDKSHNVFFTYDIHLAKALKNLDRLLSFIVNEYGEAFDKSPVNCLDLKNANLTYFYHK